ncbi:hypothetical protein [Burkholderia pseudomultivorans]|uniref:hypothetical protein n=1 Tax=Burkholderia pseudomultivorans TaxID=1207504 RepID=UPI00075868ED|nr:hypothetical protein [Burkholderia pseudomultivorans]KWE99984.1 hypothetical protein WT55_33715 [Burkholderia pseudomultivorans]
MPKRTAFIDRPLDLILDPARRAARMAGMPRHALLSPIPAPHKADRASSGDDAPHARGMTGIAFPIRLDE